MHFLSEFRNKEEFTDFFSQHKYLLIGVDNQPEAAKLWGFFNYSFETSFGYSELKS